MTSDKSLDRILSKFVLALLCIALLLAPSITGMFATAQNASSSETSDDGNNDSSSSNESSAASDSSDDGGANAENNNAADSSDDEQDPQQNGDSSSDSQSQNSNSSSISDDQAGSDEEPSQSDDNSASASNDDSDQANDEDASTTQNSNDNDQQSQSDNSSSEEQQSQSDSQSSGNSSDSANNNSTSLDNTENPQSQNITSEAAVQDSSLQAVMLPVSISGEPLLLTDKSITRSFTIPVLEFEGKIVSEVTVTITWNIDGTTEISDTRGYHYTLRVSNSNSTFTLLQNSTVIDQKVIGSGLQYDIYWYAVENSDGDVNSYKFTIAGISASSSKLSLVVGGVDQNNILLQNNGFMTMQRAEERTHRIDLASLDPSLNWTAPKSADDPTLSSILPPPQESADGLGLDWSDAIAAGYKMNFNKENSSLEITVGKVFFIDPTTIVNTTRYLSPPTSTLYEGERRIAQVNNVTFVFYRVNDGTGAPDVAYRYSTDDGQTWGSTTYMGIGEIAVDRHRWTIQTTSYSGNQYIAIMYAKEAGSNTEFYSQRGQVSGTTITWSGARLIGYTFAQGGTDCLTGGSCSAVVATTDTSGNIYAAFRWISGGSTTYSYRILRSLDAGYSWEFLFSQVDGVSTNRPAMALTRLSSGDMLFAYGLYESNKLFYRVLDMDAVGGPAWTNPPAELNGTTTGWTTNVWKQMSADSDSTKTAFLAYVAGGTSGALKVARFSNTGTYQAIENANATLSHSLPSITVTTHDVVHIYTISGGKIYDTRRVSGTWQNSVNPFGTTFTSPDQLTAAIGKSAAVWTESACFPCDIKLGTNPEWTFTNDVRITTTGVQRQFEPHLAIADTNPFLIIEAHKDAQKGNCDIYRSLDSGSTWEFRQSVPKLSSGNNQDDAVVTPNSAGTFYLACLEKGSSNSYIRVSTGTTGGTSWSTTSAVTNSNTNLDKPWIVADANSGSPYKDQVYLCWTDFTATTADIEYKRFSPSTSPISLATGPTGGLVRGCNMAVSPDGDLYVVYEQTNSNGNGSIQIRTNFFGGSSTLSQWNSSRLVGDWTRYPSNSCGFPECLGGDNNGFRVQHYPAIAVDSDGVVHVTWSSYAGSTDMSEVMYSNSANCKARGDPCTFSTPISVVKIKSGETRATDQWSPAIIASKTGDIIHISSYDRRLSSSNMFYRVYDYYCYNVRNGAIPLDCTSVGHWFNQPISSTDSRNEDGANVLDDYHGIATSKDREALTVWTDGRDVNNTNTLDMNIYFDGTKS